MDAHSLLERMCESLAAKKSYRKGKGGRKKFHELIIAQISNQRKRFYRTMKNNINFFYLVAFLLRGRASSLRKTALKRRIEKRSKGKKAK